MYAKGTHNHCIQKAPYFLVPFPHSPKKIRKVMNDPFWRKIIILLWKRMISPNWINIKWKRRRQDIGRSVFQLIISRRNKDCCLQMSRTDDSSFQMDSTYFYFTIPVSSFWSKLIPKHGIHRAGHNKQNSWLLTNGKMKHRSN